MLIISVTLGVGKWKKDFTFLRYYNRITDNMAALAIEPDNFDNPLLMKVSLESNKTRFIYETRLVVICFFACPLPNLQLSCHACEISLLYYSNTSLRPALCVCKVY